MKSLSNILLVLNFCLAFNCTANDEGIAALLEKASTEMYTNPGRLIKIGDSLLAIAALKKEEKLQVHLAMVNGYSALRDYDNALKSGNAALKLIDNSTPLKTKIRVHQVMGSQYHGLKLYAEAIHYFEKADLLIEELPKEETTDLYRGYNNVSKAFIYRDQMGCDVALTYFLRAIASYKSAVGSTTGLRNLSTTYYNKGNCEFSLQLVDSAEFSFKAAIEYAQQSDAHSLLAFAQKGLAVLYTSREEHKASLDLLEMALVNAQGVGDLVLNQAILKAISDNYLALNDYANFHKYTEKTAEIQASIAENQLKSVTRAMEEMIAQHQSRVNNAKSRHTVLLTISIIATILSLFLAFRWQVKGRRGRRILRKEISSLNQRMA